MTIVTNLLLLLRKLTRRIDGFLERKLHAVWQAEQYVLAEKAAEKFHKENPNLEKEIAELYQRLRDNKTGCTHLKGGLRRTTKYGTQIGVATLRKDPALAFHTFSDGTKKLWCLICGKFWTPESPDWKQALRMFEDSSNTPTASEIVMSPEVQRYTKVIIPERDIAVYHDPLFVVESAERPE